MSVLGELLAPSLELPFQLDQGDIRVFVNEAGRESRHVSDGEAQSVQIALSRHAREISWPGMGQERELLSQATIKIFAGRT